MAVPARSRHLGRSPVCSVVPQCAYLYNDTSIRPLLMLPYLVLCSPELYTSWLYASFHRAGELPVGDDRVDPVRSITILTVITLMLSSPFCSGFALSVSPTSHLEATRLGPKKAKRTSWRKSLLLATAASKKYQPARRQAPFSLRQLVRSSLSGSTTTITIVPRPVFLRRQYTLRCNANPTRWARLLVAVC